MPLPNGGVAQLCAEQPGKRKKQPSENNLFGIKAGRKRNVVNGEEKWERGTFM